MPKATDAEKEQLMSDTKSSDQGLVAEPAGQAGQAMPAVTPSDTVHELVYGRKRYILVGTAHVSAESVQEVDSLIRAHRPQRVCVELDAGRLNSLRSDSGWKNLDMYKVIKEGRGFLMLGNLMLSSFQKRLGEDQGIKPGAEMKAALDACTELGLPYALIDRDITVTLKRAWGKTGFWGKNKLLAALMGSVLGGEEVSAADIEELKKQSAMENMMDELAAYLPSVKTVLIDERDQYLACRLFEQTEEVVLAVVGAGHVPGMKRWLEQLHAGQASPDTAAICEVPPPGIAGKIAGWVVPAAIVALIVAGFFLKGWEGGLNNILTWVLVNGGLSALGALIALGHPLTILAGFIGAPLATLNPLLGVGMITGLVEAVLRKPRVQDMESLQTDITSLRGFFRNRVTRVLLVFILSSIGGMVGNFIAIPLLLA